MADILSGLAGLGAQNRFHAKRFEDLINRRGWVPVTWERAVKCSCYSEDTGNPDPKDPTCGGIGWLYIADLEIQVDKEQAAITLAGQSVLGLTASLTGSPDPTRTITKVTRVFNETQNVSYTIGAISGLSVAISGSPLPVPGDKVIVDYVFLRDADPSVKAIITNVDYQRDFIPAGEWLMGDAVMTVSGQYRMGFRDRITIPEQVIRTDELLRRNRLDVKGRSLERLRYKTGISIILVRDLYGVFVENVDFTIGVDATVVWGAGERPKHKAFSVKYNGNATSATMVVTTTSLVATLVGQTDGSTTITVPFATYDTVKKVVDFINAQLKYVATLDEQSNRISIENAELSSFMVPIATADVKAAAVTVFNEDRTQYTVEYMHHMAYTIYQKQGMVRRHDDGTVLPGKYWLRLWEHTDAFSNVAG